MQSQLRELTIPELGLGLRRGEFTSVALATETLEAIERVDPILHTFVAVTPERALRDADLADWELAAGHDRGPLHGLPYAVKDLIDVAGMATTAQSRLLMNN